MPQSHKKVKKNIPQHKTSTQSTSHFIVKKQWGILALLAVLVGVNLLLIASVTKIRVLSSQQNTLISVNEPRTYNNVTIKVSNVKEETNYIMGIKPTDSEKIIVLTVSITNNSEEPFEIYPTIQTFIRDDQGVTYTMVPVALDDPFEAKTLQPGESETGNLSYLVTNRPLPLLYYIENRQSNIGPFVVKLQ